MFAPARALFLGLALAAMSAPSASAADVENGRKLFRQCEACHTVDAGGKNKIGPNLHGVIGRKAGLVDGYSYSKAMAASGIVWDDANLGEYLERPAAFLKGNKMAFAGMRKDTDRADVIAFIKDASK
jgi:cytochrome c